jgi:2-oxoglutarate ferredoxin oxidoreductase subunit alpha
VAHVNHRERQFLSGNVAMARGAIAAGCNYYAGYPITPSSGIMTEIAAHFQATGAGVFAQMEDEIASACSLIGASWSGARAMTATSGPGFSLMQEALGYAYFTETPMVVINVQRAGPATGQATRVAQGDIMQFRYGSHGDVFPLVFCPASVADCFSLTALAFRYSEMLRLPVFIAADESVAQLRETAYLDVPAPVVPRRAVDDTPFDADIAGGVPGMPSFGDGAALLVTGSTHDGHGMRRVDSPEVHERLVVRLRNKTLLREAELDQTLLEDMADAEVAIVAYGICARSARAAKNALRQSGARVGLVHLRTLWPFPQQTLQAACANTPHVVVAELNLGQLAAVVQGVLMRPVHALSQVNGLPMSPGKIAAFIAELS